jgi:hypothetical protein
MRNLWIATAKAIAPVLIALTGISLTACSGGDNPPLMAFESQADTAAADSGAAPAQAAAPAARCAEEGAFLRCGQLLAQQGSSWVCTIGSRVCTGGTWSECSVAPAQPTQLVAPSVGCNDPMPALPDACPTEGATRDCVVNLDRGNSPSGNCFHGEQVCQSGAWTACAAPSAKGKGK